MGDTSSQAVPSPGTPQGPVATDTSMESVSTPADGLPTSLAVDMTPEFAHESTTDTPMESLLPDSANRLVSNLDVDVTLELTQDLSTDTPMGSFVVDQANGLMRNHDEEISRESAQTCVSNTPMEYFVPNSADGQVASFADQEMALEATQTLATATPMESSGPCLSNELTANLAEKIVSEYAGDVTTDTSMECLVPNSADCQKVSSTEEQVTTEPIHLATDALMKSLAPDSTNERVANLDENNTIESNENLVMETLIEPMVPERADCESNSLPEHLIQESAQYKTDVAQNSDIASHEMTQDIASCVSDVTVSNNRPHAMDTCDKPHDSTTCNGQNDIASNIPHHIYFCNKYPYDVLCEMSTVISRAMPDDIVSCDMPHVASCDMLQGNAACDLTNRIVSCDVSALDTAETTLELLHMSEELVPDHSSEGLDNTDTSRSDCSEDTLDDASDISSQSDQAANDDTEGSVTADDSEESDYLNMFDSPDVDMPSDTLDLHIPEEIACNVSVESLTTKTSKGLDSTANSTSVETADAYDTDDPPLSNPLSDLCIDKLPGLVFEDSNQESDVTNTTRFTNSRKRARSTGFDTTVITPLAAVDQSSKQMATQDTFNSTPHLTNDYFQLTETKSCTSDIAECNSPNEQIPKSEELKSTDNPGKAVPQEPVSLTTEEAAFTEDPMKLAPKHKPANPSATDFQTKDKTSVLSPFAEPFMPRDNLLSRPVKDFSSTNKTTDLPPTQSDTVLHQDYTSTSLAGSQCQPLPQTIDTLLEDSYKQVISPLFEASFLAGCRLQEVIENRNKIEGPFNAPDLYFDMKNSLQPKSRDEKLAVGYERTQKDRPASAFSIGSSGTDLSTSKQVNNSVFNFPAYQLFSKRGYSDSADLTFSKYVYNNNLSEKYPSLFNHFDAFSGPDSTNPYSTLSLDNEHAANHNKRHKASPSLNEIWSANSQTETQGNVHEPNSNVELPIRNSQIPTQSENGYKTDCAEADVQEHGDDGLLNEDEALFKDPLDWPDSSLIDIQLNACTADNHNKPQTDDISAQKRTDNTASTSADSGIGSFSDQSSISIPKSDSDSDVSPKSSPTGPRFCRQHSEEVTMYCAEGCEMMCRSCRIDHTQCGRVLNISLACRDVRCRLLKVQSRIDLHIHSLEEKVGELKPEGGEITKRKFDVMKEADNWLQEIIQEARANHKRKVKQIEEESSIMAKTINDKMQKAERTLCMLNAVNKFLEVLRHQDSGWDLLSTFDHRLGVLLNRVLLIAERNLEFIQSNSELDQQKLDHCHNIAFDAIRQIVDSDWADKLAEEFTQENPLLQDEKNRATEFHSKESDINGNSNQNMSNKQSDSYPLPEDSYEERLIQELSGYLQRCSPPENLNGSVTSSLYDVMENLESLSPNDFYDDVFLFDSQSQGKKPPSDVFTRQKVSSTSEYKIQQRVSPYFPQDRERAFITDLLVTETGLLVFLDAANSSLKRLHLDQVLNNPLCIPVPQPLAMCSAGWDRVMVSSAGRTLGVYSVGGYQMSLVIPRTTQHQYRGLVRASDSLIAAACPETGSVDLLDLAGRALRSVMPVDFVRGPEVVGVTHTGELLVVHQPSTPPTTLVCFDMSGKVTWSHELHTSLRHVSCSKVVGAADGGVYLALQGDSVLYKIIPSDTSEDNPADPMPQTVLLNSRNGIKFPSSLAVTGSVSVIVTRNELPHVPSRASNHAHMLPSTTEIDVFVPIKTQNTK